MSNRTEFIFVEAQIRTVAMDFWASLEHKIYYTYEGEVPDDIHRDLRDAAQRANALDQQMAEIRDRVTGLSKQNSSSDQERRGHRRPSGPRRAAGMRFVNRSGHPLN